MLNAWGKSQGEVVAAKPFWQEEIEKSSAMTFYYQAIIKKLPASPLTGSGQVFYLKN
jgi:hypothetical protein